MRRIDIQKISKNSKIQGNVAREMAKALRQVDDDTDTTRSWEGWKMVQKEVEEAVIGTSAVNKQKL